MQALNTSLPAIVVPKTIGVTPLLSKHSAKRQRKREAPVDDLANTCSVDSSTSCKDFIFIMINLSRIFNIQRPI